MKQSLFTLLLLAMISILSGCCECIIGTGEIQSEDRLLKAFTAIELKCSTDVIIRHKSMDEKNNVVIEAQPNLMPFITTKVSGSTLEIDMEGCVKTNQPMIVYVDIDRIDKISNDGSGNITCTEELISDELEIHQNGSGNISAIVRANHLELNLHGSGNVELSGNGNKIDIESNGSGSCDALMFIANEGKVNLNGSGAVSVFASKEMNLELNGSGSIHYGGKPEKLNTKKNGSGEIHEAQ